MVQKFTVSFKNKFMVYSYTHSFLDTSLVVVSHSESYLLMLAVLEFKLN